jgi:hypothetical protein
MDIGGKHTDRKKRYKIVALLGGSFYLECVCTSETICILRRILFVVVLQGAPCVMNCSIFVRSSMISE